MRRRGRGFTLIELLIVVAIIGIIVAIAIPNLLDAVDRAKQRATVAEIRNWGNGLGSYVSERGLFPPTGNNLVSSIFNALVPYAISTLRRQDGWKHDYRYYTDSSSYTLRSYGKDGLVGLGVTPTTWQNFNLDIIMEDGIFSNSP